jgi:ribosomal-protein-alanine N-acetyltransferase
LLEFQFRVRKVTECPVIETERLILRLFEMDDAPEVQLLANDSGIASTTSEGEIPEAGKEEQWIKIRQERFGRGESIEFAIVHREMGVLIGAIGLGVEYKKDESMQMGYWVGKQYWNRGYCTEAAQAVLRYGFEVLGLHRIYSRHFTRNPASGRVLQKIGMKHEGTLREAFKKWGKFENLECYGILRSEYTGSID